MKNKMLQQSMQDAFKSQKAGPNTKPQIHIYFQLQLFIFVTIYKYKNGHLPFCITLGNFIIKAFLLRVMNF